MQTAKIPLNEFERLEELYSLGILDTEAESDFDDLTKIASQILETPIALVSLIDKDRQWFKSKVGMDNSETPREIAFCSHAILGPEKIFSVPDASLDERFSNNPLVVDSPKIRFYLGAPLVTKNGYPIGTLCAIDRVPRVIDSGKEEALKILAKQTMAQIELRATNRSLNNRFSEMTQLKKELEEYHKRISRDLTTAQEIQNSLMSVEYKKCCSYQIQSRYVPTDEVGGDAIGSFQQDSENRFDIYFGDVSGHGVTSALISSMSLMAFETTAPMNLDPAESLFRMHKSMHRMHENHFFISACYLRIMIREKKLFYAYAGHHEILVLRENKIIELKGRGSLLLTILPQNRDVEIFQLQSNDKILLFSDGFFDVFNQNMEQLGWARLKEWVLEMNLTHPSNFADILIEKVQEFSDKKRSDDMTFLQIIVP
jgi:serine phosphatase RsbU (regulator of sigma subunit)